MMNTEKTGSGYFQQGMILFHRGDFPGAQRLLELALKEAREQKDLQHLSGILGNLGNICATLGETRKAAAFYQEVLDIQKKAPDYRTVGQTLVNLGNLFREKGESNRARAYYLEAKDFIEKAQDNHSLGTLFSNLGLLEMHAGEVGKAIPFFKKALDLHKQTGNEEGLAATWGQLGKAYQFLKVFKKAETCFNFSYTHFGHIGHPSGEKEALVYLADLYELREQRELSLRCLERVLEINKRFRFKEPEEFTIRVKNLRKAIHPTSVYPNLKAKG
ncbi:MAG TPA: tetratricopeptide repeat protein [Nitrospiria bacterium]|jgi:tetratricopeptide (TPR) repeat protein